MKKLLSILSLLIFAINGWSQFPVQQNLGAPNTQVNARGGLGFDSTLVARGGYADTTAANLGFIDNIPSAIIRTVNTLWIRNTTATAWIEFGAGSLNIDTTQSIILNGDGSPSDPLTANLQVSTQSGNILQVFPDGVYATAQTQIQNGLISGGLVIWQTGLTYIVTPATYAIGGVIYNSPQTTITLDNADPTDPRFDAFVVTTDETAENITGTPAADPQNPSYDPETQLPLTFVQVTANMTEPVFCRDSIYYISNGQTWTGVVSNAGRINTTSTNNPYSVTEDVEFTAAQNGDQYRVTKSSTIDFATYSVLTFQIRSKATWATNSRVNIRAYNGLTPLGINVALGDGIFGFNSSITNAYQLIAIPVGNLGGGLSTATNILFTISTTGGNTLGFYLDDIQLLGCDGTPIPVTGRFWSQGGDRWGTTGVLGTLDNNNLQFITNNTNAIRVSSNAQITTLQGTNPILSMFLGTGSNSDYYWQRTGTTMLTNTAGDYINRFQGNTVYSFIAASGHIWNNSTATFGMQLNSSGNLLLGTNANNATTIFNVSSTTKGSHAFPSMTDAQMLAISTPQTGDMVYNSTNVSPYYYNSVAWVPFGNVTANNGANIDGVNNVQWGGPLVEATTINGAALYKSVFTSSIPTATDSATVVVRNTGTGAALYGTAQGSGNGVVARSSTGTALNSIGGSVGAFIRATSGLGVNVFGTTIGASITVSTSSTNTVEKSLQLTRLSSGTAATGIGNSIIFLLQDAGGNTDEVGSFDVVATSATSLAMSTRFDLNLSNGGVVAKKMSVAATGALQLTNYGSGTFTGTPTYTLQVDASGNIIEGAVGAGTGDVVKVGTPVNNQVAVWTGDPTLEGDAALTFTGGALTVGLAGTTLGQLVLSGNTAQTVTLRTLATAGNYTLTFPTTDGSAGEVLSTDGSGNLSWIAAGAVGTVTNVTWTGGIVSIANPTTVPAFTIAGTSGGIPYFSSSSTWASSAALAANAIVIGGGAGVAPSTTTTASGILTFLGTPSSANLRTAVTDETGTGALYFQSGDIGTPTAGTISTGVTLGNVTMDVTGTDATGDMYYRAGGILTRLGIGTSGQILRTSAGGIPEWATISGSGTMTSATITQPAAGITVTNSGVAQTTVATWTIALANDLAAVEGLATTGIVRRTGTSTWSAGTLVSLSTEVTGTLPVTSGGTGQTTYTNGQLLIGNTTGNTLTKSTLTGTANQINITNGTGSITISMAFNPTEQTLSDAATTTWNVTNGGNAVWTNSGTNRTLTLSNVVAGYTYTLRIIQGAGGSHTVSTWTNMHWSGGTLPTLSTTAGAIDVVRIYAVTSTNLYATFVSNIQ